MKNGLEIDSDGNKFYYENGELHRLGSLPACEYFNGDKIYFEYNKLHRLDGPAVDWNGRKEWWVNDKYLKCKTQEKFIQLMKLKAFW